MTWSRRLADGIRQERSHLVGRGQDAEDVEVDAADELAVGAELGRADPHPVELREDGPVDHVVLGNSAAWRSPGRRPGGSVGRWPPG